jgi:ribosomal protein L37AE/L43A
MKRLAIGAGAALVFAACVASLYALQGGFKTPEAKAFTHVHCPECEQEMKYRPELDGKACPQCGPQQKLVPTVGPHRAGESRQEGKLGKLLVSVVVAAVLLQGGFYGLYLYQRARRRAEEEAQNRVLVCRCPFCTRKIGYLAKKIGTGMICSRCETAFVLPSELEAEEVM